MVQVIRLPWSPVREVPKLRTGHIPPPHPLNQVVCQTDPEIVICHTTEEIFKKPVLHVRLDSNQVSPMLLAIMLSLGEVDPPSVTKKIATRFISDPTIWTTTARRFWNYNNKQTRMQNVLDIIAPIYVKWFATK